MRGECRPTALFRGVNIPETPLLPEASRTLHLACARRTSADARNTIEPFCSVHLFRTNVPLNQRRMDCTHERPAKREVRHTFTRLNIMYMATVGQINSGAVEGRSCFSVRVQRGRYKYVAAARVSPQVSQPAAPGSFISKTIVAPYVPAILKKTIFSRCP